MRLENKKGDIASIIYIVIFLFVVAIALLFISHLNDEIYSELDTALNSTHGENISSEVRNTLIKSQTINREVWDWAFLGIFMGSLLAIGLSAYAVRISPIFYWVYALLSLVVLALGIILSNIWQDMAADAEFAVTIARFPITNAILGSYFPMVVTAITILAMIIIFGKLPGREGEI